MALTAETFMSTGCQANSECLGAALGDLLRARYPFHTAKMIAADLNCSVKTAQNLLAGHLSAKTATRLVRAYGWDLFTEALAAVTGRSLRQYIREKEEQAAREQRTWEAQRREMAALAASLEVRLAERSGEPLRLL